MIWDFWKKNAELQSLEKKLNELGIHVVVMNDYLRLSHSNVKFYSTDEFKVFAERLIQENVHRRLKSKAKIGAGAANSKVTVNLGDPPPSDTDALLGELDKLVGLDAVKSNVRSLVNLMRVRRMRNDQGLSVPDVSLHMVFSGNPGTGKTTVARLIARIYAAIGVLSRGQFVEVDRSGLVAGYVGQTALKTNEIIQSALGGVLFIDEAYALVERGSQDFGNEAIETLLKAMEDHRGNLIVIAAGYTENMIGFIRSNPGLMSRFARTIDFPDYKIEELLLIAERMASEHGFVLDHDARDVLSRTLAQLNKQNGVQFGNARGVRNFFELILDAQANRIVNLDTSSRIDLQTLKLADIVSATKI